MLNPNTSATAVVRDLFHRHFDAAHGGYSNTARLYREAANTLADLLDTDEFRDAWEGGRADALAQVNVYRAKYNLPALDALANSQRVSR